jgi:glucan phosphoethanolaminetransferase (alkaline phosphatase superfamily)
LLQAIGLNMGFLVWLVGIVVAIALAVVTLRFNLQKWVIIIATSLLGAGVVFGGFFVLYNPWSKLLENPIKAFLSSSPLLMILAIALAVFGIVVQYRNSRTFTLDTYNNWE